MTTSPDAAPELDVPRERRPAHIAIIMDGNGRWAQARQEPRVFGHREGARAVRRIVTECSRLELEALTLFSFSSENWKRPDEEVGALMELLLEYLANERQELLDNGIRFRQIGRREGLSNRVLDALDETTEITSTGTGLTLVLALNYGARAELTDATRSIAAKVQAGTLELDAIDENVMADHLYTRGLPDPDLLIRTAGELRLSNYLLWQLSYAEFHVTDVFWPDFDHAELHRAIRVYAGRDRRFGAIDSTST